MNGEMILTGWQLVAFCVFSFALGVAAAFAWAWAKTPSHRAALEDHADLIDTHSREIEDLMELHAEGREAFEQLRAAVELRLRGQAAQLEDLSEWLSLVPGALSYGPPYESRAVVDVPLPGDQLPRPGEQWPARPMADPDRGPAAARVIVGADGAPDRYRHIVVTPGRGGDDQGAELGEREPDDQADQLEYVHEARDAALQEVDPF